VSKIEPVLRDEAFANRWRRKTLTFNKLGINFPAACGRSASGKFSTGQIDTYEAEPPSRPRSSGRRL
jgi:hypothetical protein